ncbi:TMEM165/GDT1 family protein [filamentous cyanobacterium LEGE 07170]|nr:TMEM165/GDT1 family protein [filamentous cyanobacterium LEGE 07170]
MMAISDEPLQSEKASSPTQSSDSDMGEPDRANLDDAKPSPQDTLTWKGELQIFLSTFLTIFLAEVGDKTQLTVFLMSAESGSPWTIFLGAGSALIATSLCGILLGRWLSQHVSPKLLERFAAVLLLAIATVLLLDVWQG